MSGVYAFKHHISVAAHKPEAFKGLGFMRFYDHGWSSVNRRKS